jgi:hypothetical protein
MNMKADVSVFLTALKEAEGDLGAKLLCTDVRHHDRRLRSMPPRRHLVLELYQRQNLKRQKILDSRYQVNERIF